jgi:polysaccharide pyruvyl transferase WcaK-like protein
MNILLMGYYGHQNVGDDLFVKQLTRYFSNNNAVKKIFVLCKDAYYERVSDKVVFFPVHQLTKLKKLALILRSDCLAWGGGTLNLGGRPTDLLRMQAITKVTGKQFCFLGVGLNPGISKDISDVFRKADLLYVRDRYSYQIATQEFKFQNSCYLGGDLAFLDLSLYESLVKKNHSTPALSNLSFCGKHWWGEGRCEFYAQQLKPLIEKHNTMIHFLPGHVGDERNDNNSHRLLLNYLPASNCKLHSWKDPLDFCTVLSQMDFHIGTRLHSLIIADILGVPNIGIGSKKSKIGYYLDKTEVLSSERVVEAMQPLPITQIETVLQQYRRPNEFINNESRTAQQCIAKIFK